MSETPMLPGMPPPAPAPTMSGGVAEARQLLEAAIAEWRAAIAKGACCYLWEDDPDQWLADEMAGFSGSEACPDTLTCDDKRDWSRKCEACKRAFLVSTAVRLLQRREHQAVAFAKRQAESPSADPPALVRVVCLGAPSCGDGDCPHRVEDMPRVILRNEHEVWPVSCPVDGRRYTQVTAAGAAQSLDAAKLLAVLEGRE